MDRTKVDITKSRYIASVKKVENCKCLLVDEIMVPNCNCLHHTRGILDE